MNGATSIAVAEKRLVALTPGIVSALSFSAADVFGKVVFNDGMDVLSFVTTRGVLTVATEIDPMVQYHRPSVAIRQTNNSVEPPA